MIATDLRGPDALAADFRQRLTNALLSDVVDRIAARRDLWEPLVSTVLGDRVGERTWARLPVREDLDVFVVTWRTSSHTSLHSHGGAASAFRTVEGVLTEIRPDTRGRLIPRNFAPGLTALIAADEVHDLRNERGQRAVSVHAYAPGLTSITYVDIIDGAARPIRTTYPGTSALDPHWPRATRP